jgi:hypothetical protein
MVEYRFLGFVLKIDFWHLFWMLHIGVQQFLIGAYCAMGHFDKGHKKYSERWYSLIASLFWEPLLLIWLFKKAVFRFTAWIGALMVLSLKKELHKKIKNVGYPDLKYEELTTYFVFMEFCISFINQEKDSIIYSTIWNWYRRTKLNLGYEYFIRKEKSIDFKTGYTEAQKKRFFDTIQTTAEDINRDHEIQKESYIRSLPRKIKTDWLYHKGWFLEEGSYDDEEVDKFILDKYELFVKEHKRLPFEYGEIKGEHRL